MVGSGANIIDRSGETLNVVTRMARLDQNSFKPPRVRQLKRISIPIYAIFIDSTKKRSTIFSRRKLLLLLQVI